jgi:hypothetical protein
MLCQLQGCAVPDGKERKDGKSKEGKQTSKDTQRRKVRKGVVTE